MSVLGVVTQADSAAGDAVVSAVTTVRVVDERAGSAVQSASAAVPTPGVLSKARRAVGGAGTLVDAGIELYARGMLVTLAWVLALLYWPIVPVAPVLAGLLTVYLYGL